MLWYAAFAHISEQEESSPDSSELRYRKIAFNFVRHSYGLTRMDLTPKCIRKRRAQGPLTYPNGPRCPLAVLSMCFLNIMLHVTMCASICQPRKHSGASALKRPKEHKRHIKKRKKDRCQRRQQKVKKICSGERMTSRTSQSNALNLKVLDRTQDQSSEKGTEPVDSKTGDIKGKTKEVREGTRETQDVTSDIEEPDPAEKQEFDDYLNALGEMDNDKNINKIIQNSTLKRNEKNVGDTGQQQSPFLRNTMENIPVRTEIYYDCWSSRADAKKMHAQQIKLECYLNGIQIG
ncbi:unnamed protein product [Cylicocyclus nassatus]|uniref:Uncharacterized protein n=1 Tax=Cylicocyclus nassatus TaxID=53992 RepID=A0AA36HCX1_CYLNA|nr:unnamed protein product [Cylicocyclus nassatus]